MEIRSGGPQADDGGGIVGEPLAGSLGRGQAPPLHFGGPPPRHVFAPDLLCPLMVHALRSTRRPLTNHPNEPRATDEGRKGVGGDSLTGIHLGLHAHPGSRSGKESPSSEGHGRVKPKTREIPCPIPISGLSPEVQQADELRVVAGARRELSGYVPEVSPGPVLADPLWRPRRNRSRSGRRSCESRS